MIIIDGNQPRGLGYLQIDQRNVHAPLPAGTQRHLETDTYTCSHCQKVVILNPNRTRERYKCTGCQHHICDTCAAEKFAGKQCKTFWQQANELLEKSVRQTNPSPIILP